MSPRKSQMNHKHRNLNQQGETQTQNKPTKELFPHNKNKHKDPKKL